MFDDDDLPGPEEELDNAEDVETEVEGDAEGEGGSDDLEADSGDEDAPGEGEGEEGESGQVEARRPSRAQARVENALREAREAKEEARRAREEAAEARREREQRQQGESERERRERLALMSPDERTEFLLNEQGQRFERELFNIRFQTADNADRTRFEALAARTPAYAAIADEVETKIAEARAKGDRSLSREVLAKFLIGERAIARAARASNKQNRKAAADRQRQTARPAGGRSDVAADRRVRGDSPEARRKRLEGVVF